MGRRNDDAMADTEEIKVTLADYVLPELVDAFCATYEPLEEWEDGCDVLTYTQLRNIFKAVLTTLGDPFIIYKQLLLERGFAFKVDIATREFVIYVRPKF